MATSHLFNIELAAHEVCLVLVHALLHLEPVQYPR